MKKINLEEKFALIAETWSPRILAELNGQQVKIAKLHGEFVWHAHEREDELFLVIQGELRILFRDGEVTLRPGEICVVPRGIEHKPIADAEVQVLLLEPSSTLNTGTAGGPRTVGSPEWI